MTKYCGRVTSVGHGEGATCGKPFYDTIHQCDQCRIRELEAEVAYWKDSHIKADKSWSDGVRDGIERVRRQSRHWREPYPTVSMACDRALAAFEREQSDG